MPETPDGWTLTPQGLTRTWAWKDFVEALAFVVAVAKIAEERNHHPDVDIRWNKVHLSIMTHSAGKVTDLDFALAAAINGISGEDVKRACKLLGLP